LITATLRQLSQVARLARLNLLEPPSSNSLTPVVIPFHDCIILVSLLNCAEFVGRLSEVSLEQIKFLLGHESILTTQRYLGSEQNLKNAVNDALVFE
jgi:hypothetical protein